MFINCPGFELMYLLVGCGGNYVPYFVCLFVLYFSWVMVVCVVSILG